MVWSCLGRGGVGLFVVEWGCLGWGGVGLFGVE